MDCSSVESLLCASGSQFASLASLRTALVTWGPTGKACSWRAQSVSVPLHDSTVTTWRHIGVTTGQRHQSDYVAVLDGEWRARCCGAGMRLLSLDKRVDCLCHRDAVRLREQAV